MFKKSSFFLPDSIPVSSHTVEEAAPESEDGRVSPLSSIPSSQSQDIRSAASGETRKEPRKDNSTLTLSSSFGDDKSAYSSVVGQIAGSLIFIAHLLFLQKIITHSFYVVSDRSNIIQAL